MPADFSLDLRRAVVAFLRSRADVMAVVDAVYPEQPPKLPDGAFIRVGAPIAAPWEATGYDGSEHTFTLHAFAKGPGTDAVATIAKRLVAAMRDIEPAAFSLPDNEWTGTQIIPDGDEADAWHAIVDFRIIAADRAA